MPVTLPSSIVGILIYFIGKGLLLFTIAPCLELRLLHGIADGGVGVVVLLLSRDGCEALSPWIETRRPLQPSYEGLREALVLQLVLNKLLDRDGILGVSHLLQLVHGLLASFRLLLRLMIVVEHRPLQVLDPQPIIDRPLDLDVGLAEDLVVKEEGRRGALKATMAGRRVDECEELVCAEAKAAFPRHVHAGDV